MDRQEKITASDIIIKRITDFSVPMDIMIKGEIFPQAFEDGCEMALPDMINEYYLGAWVPDHGLIGFYKIQQIGQHLYQGHANIMKQYRSRYALSATWAAVIWIDEHIPGFETLLAWVPQKYKNVVHHLKKVGFNFCGTIPQAFKKDGEFMPIDIFSITSAEILNKKDK